MTGNVFRLMFYVIPIMENEMKISEASAGDGKITIHTIGNKLKELRLKKGYDTLEKFVADYSLPPCAYSKIENGLINLTFNQLKKILSYYNLSMDEFFTSLLQDNT